MNADMFALIVHTHGGSSKNIPTDVGSVPLEPTTAFKYLGTWWTPNLTPTNAIAENIAKACKAFFSFWSSGVFQGELNPLSSHSLVEMSVMHASTLFGSESWCLTNAALGDLDHLQCSIGKIIPRLKYNTSVLIRLDWPSMSGLRPRVLIRKLSYLRMLVGGVEVKLTAS